MLGLNEDESGCPRRLFHHSIFLTMSFNCLSIFFVQLRVHSHEFLFRFQFETLFCFRPAGPLSISNFHIHIFYTSSHKFDVRWRKRDDKNLVWHESVIKADKSMAITDAWPPTRHPQFFNWILIDFFFSRALDGNRFMVTTIPMGILVWKQFRKGLWSFK